MQVKATGTETEAHPEIYSFHVKQHSLSIMSKAVNLVACIAQLTTVKLHKDFKERWNKNTFYRSRDTHF